VTSLADNDFRRPMPRFGGPAAEANIAITAAVREIAVAHDALTGADLMTLGALADLVVGGRYLAAATGLRRRGARCGRGGWTCAS
jgi:hypothetical protein